MEDDDVDFSAIRRSQQDMVARQYDRWMKTLPRLPQSPISFYDKVVVDEYMTVTIGEWGGYLIQILSMGFNNRIVLAPKGTLVFDYGWCYDRGPTALMAALIWNPETEAEPVGFKKVAGAAGREPGQRAGALTANAAHGLALILAMELPASASDE